MLAAPRAAVLRLAMFSIVLLIGSAAIAWALSRRITRPLAELTGAAETIARGDYSARVTPRGAGELVRLAASFNRMADEIRTTHSELEMQAAEAEAVNVDLDRARGRRAGEPRQERVPRGDEPRAAHAAQRDRRLRASCWSSGSAAR